MKNLISKLSITLSIYYLTIGILLAQSSVTEDEMRTMTDMNKFGQMTNVIVFAIVLIAVGAGIIILKTVIKIIIVAYRQSKNNQQLKDYLKSKDKQE